MTNIEKFNIITAELFALLYDEFPLRVARFDIYEFIKDRNLACFFDEIDKNGELKSSEILNDEMALFVRETMLFFRKREL